MKTPQCGLSDYDSTSVAAAVLHGSAAVESLQVTSTIVHAQSALHLVGVYVSASRLYNEHYDAHCRAMGIEAPQRRVKLEPRVIIRKLH